VATQRAFFVPGQSPPSAANIMARMSWLPAVAMLNVISAGIQESRLFRRLGGVASSCTVNAVVRDIC
jgi:hypothetical protein